MPKLLTPLRSCRVGAGRGAFWSVSATPLSEPCRPLLAHTALPLSIRLRFLVMTRETQCLKVAFDIGIYWPFEPADWADMINLSGAMRHRCAALLTGVLIPFQDIRP